MESVLIIDSDVRRRKLIVAACRARGMKARGVARVAEIRRWPVRDIVVSDLAHLSHWWVGVGASRVVALAAGAAEAEAAMANGATEWITSDVSAEGLAEVLAERMTVDRAWTEPAARSAFDEFLDNEAFAAEEFISEADLQPTRMAAAASRGQDALRQLAAGGAVIDDFAAESPRPRRLGGAARLAVVGATFATFGTGAYVYQQMRTATPDRVVAAARSAGDLRLEADRDVIRAAPQRPAQAPPPEPRPRVQEPVRPPAVAAPASSTVLDSSTLSGRWALNTQVESSAVAAFEGMQLGFDMELQQDGGRVTGNGWKVSENGRVIRGARQTPIAVEGYEDGNQLALTFTEAGTRRRSSGTFTLIRTSGGELRGRFSSNAARSAGTVEARRQ